MSSLVPCSFREKYFNQASPITHRLRGDSFFYLPFRNMSVLQNYKFFQIQKALGHEPKSKDIPNGAENFLSSIFISLFCFLIRFCFPTGKDEKYFSICYSKLLLLHHYHKISMVEGMKVQESLFYLYLFIFWCLYNGSILEDTSLKLNKIEIFPQI